MGEEYYFAHPPPRARSLRVVRDASQVSRYIAKDTVIPRSLSLSLSLSDIPLHI